MFLLVLLSLFLFINGERSCNYQMYGINSFLVYQVQGCNRLTLQPDRTKFVLPAGESVQSRCFCNKDSNENAEVAWQFENGDKVPKKTNRNRNRPHHTALPNQNGATLVIPNLSKRWEGVYRCVGGQRVIENITIEIEQPPGKSVVRLCVFNNYNDELRRTNDQ